MTYPITPLTTPSRYPDRVSYERAAIHELLDSEHLCHVGFVIDGEPRVLPTLFVRVGETLYLHGSTAATWLLKGRRDEGLPVVVSVAAMDALVLARAQPHHSANYRSLVAHGMARPVSSADAKREAMAALIDKVGPGRSGHTRAPTPAELAKTAVLALDLDQVSMKRRAGGPADDEEDLDLPCWAGVVPLITTRGFGQPADGVTVPPPPYVPARSPWHAAEVLRGEHVMLEPLASADAAELFTALDHADVWTHTHKPRPTRASGMAAIVETTLADPELVAWTQRLAKTGEIVGLTAYYNINEVDERLAIGYTQLSRSWWRTAVNTEAKLLLLTRAFEMLGAGRVEWHTDIRNLRSQAAIERLGARREGVFRRHRRRPDGSWRETIQYSMTADEWPENRDRLVARLGNG